MEKINELFNWMVLLAEEHPDIAKYMTTASRWVFVILAVYILVRNIISLLSTRPTPEVWGYLYIENGVSEPVTHWENIIGRTNSADIRVPAKTISKNHCILARRGDEWIIKDLGSTNKTVVNGVELVPGKRYIIVPGDEIILGDAKCILASISVEEGRNNEELRRLDKEPLSPWMSMIAITVFQILTVIQLVIRMGDVLNGYSILAFGLLSLTMWVFVILFKLLGRKGFELEMIAFFLSTISLSITASAASTQYGAPTDPLKQYAAVLIGLVIYVIMCIFLRDLDRTRRIRPVLVALSVVFLLFNLIFGTIKYGAANWVYIGGVSIQPSEIVKLAFICVGAGTLEELFEKKNLYTYAAFSLFCLACLAVMGDFGTALIFFVTFVVVSFLRSGDFSRMILTAASAGIMGLMIIRFKPYIASRFGAWGHVWDPAYMNDAGYQQTRTMAYGAGGGLLGLGTGGGELKYLDAANTDLVFGMVTEEWGYIIAVLLVICIITFSLFAVNSIVAGRSTFYTIASCGAATMFTFQTMLNVFGSVDLFPLTGVTFPFVSAGGTSMLVSWAMLAYFKAADMRKDASLAISGRKFKVET